MIMRLIYAGIALLCATLGFADTITLKNGRVINGTYLGGTARTIRIDDGVNVQTFDVSDIRRIEFSGSSDESSSSSGSSSDSSDVPTLRRAPSSSSSGSSSDSSDVPTLRRAPSTSSSDSDNDPDRPILHRNPENVMRPGDSTSSPIPTVAPTTGAIPAGTNLTIRMIESVDSETNRVGQTFRASLEQPVMVDGQTAIPRGADVIVKLVEAKESGKLRQPLTRSRAVKTDSPPLN